MKCPFCQNEMQRGYIQCRDGVTWTPKMAMIGALSSWKKGSVSLSNDIEGSRSTVYAYHCGQCKNVIIPYGEANAKKFANEIANEADKT